MYIYTAIQVDKTGKGWGESGPAGPRGGGSAGKEFHQFLKRSLAGERMGRARLPKTARARRLSTDESPPLRLPFPPLVIVSNLNAPVSPVVVKSYFTLQGLEALPCVTSLPPPPLSSLVQEEVGRESNIRGRDKNRLAYPILICLLNPLYFLWTIDIGVESRFQGKFVGEGGEKAFFFSFRSYFRQIVEFRAQQVSI